MQQEHQSPSTSSSNSNEASAYRKVLRQATAAILTQNECGKATAPAHETLTQLMETYILALSEGTKHAYEAATRTKPFYGDVVVSLANLGVEEASLNQFLCSQLGTAEPLVIQTPKIEPPSRFQQSLQVGKARSHPPYIADGMPSFPDPHTYIRTEISGDPEISYDKVREYASEVDRESRKNLIDLMQRRFPTLCLFEKFHENVKEQAQQLLDDQRRNEATMAEMRRQAAKKARVEKELKEVKNAYSAELSDEILEDPMDLGERNEDMPQSSLRFGSIEESLKKYERRETVKNLVAKKLPPYCFILEPQTEFRPYLSCLATEDGNDEGMNGEMTSSTSTTSMMMRKQKDDDGNTIVDNSYLRPPRIPSRDDSQIEE
ncbi:unnamed protein product, partial [Mesorhabditis belari]|uniref:Transcription initiation factor TFIID subunit 8 n=1 Tax=Mesorhabditis belari TaxID=2138241 RepID=A0AAF3ED14_9BILA